MPCLAQLTEIPQTQSSFKTREFICIIDSATQFTAIKINKKVPPILIETVIIVTIVLSSLLFFPEATYLLSLRESSVVEQFHRLSESFLSKFLRRGSITVIALIGLTGAQL